jgi:hypothetical protein
LVEHANDPSLAPVRVGADDEGAESVAIVKANPTAVKAPGS